MNHTQTETGALATADKFAPAAQASYSSSALVFDGANMDRMMRVAELMASGRSTIPKHLQGNVGDCFAVVMQSMQWQMNPFAVAQKTNLVNGTLGYEGQLVAAVINNSPLMANRLQFEWFGPWEKIIGKFKTVESRTKKDDDGSPKKYIVPDWKIEDERGLGIRVSGLLKGEETPRVLELLMTQARTRNSTLWTEDPKQQIAYLAERRWARLHAPDVLLGVYTPDELAEQAPPKDMGTADVVSDWREDLLTQGREAADKGTREYGRFWQGLGREVQQKLVRTKEHADFKEQAVQADRNRTVDAPAPASAPQDGGSPVKSFEQVKQMIEAAKDEAALAVALDWANALPKEEEGRAAELLPIYEARLAALKGGAK